MLFRTEKVVHDIKYKFTNYASLIYEYFRVSALSDVNLKRKTVKFFRVILSFVNLLEKL